jgi:hypothetical protein
MAVPKGFRNNININKQHIGPERRQDILDGITDNGTFLPRGVLEEDMDETFIDFVKSTEGLSITIDGEKVPVIFLTLQRWMEFTRTWSFNDDYKDISMPFITITRKPDIQQGQNQAGLWNIPVNRNYTMVKVPTWDGVRRGVDLYKIPQPISVDLSYEVRLFTTRMRDLNKLNNKVQRAFQSRQCYINVNGHPMPLHLETIGDESNINDFSDKKFYVQNFEIKLLGYILDEEDYKIIPTLNRTLITTELEENIIRTNIILDAKKESDKVVYSFIFNPNSVSQFVFTAQYDMIFTLLTEIINITRITISKNNLVIFDGNTLGSPISIKASDVITVKIYKNLLNLGSFKLIGNTL